MPPWEAALQQRDDGIFVSIHMADGTTVTGFAAGADSPNDFWTKFRTQLVRVEGAEVLAPGADHGGRRIATLYVNRDQIALVTVIANT